ncbi:MAG: hypothetical protein PHY36_03720 [Methanocellales archaeon]|nr:hypothetical protein [Methanocellales archaeon]
MKQKICFVLVLTVAFLALISGAQAAHWITGTVNDAADTTPADGHTVIIYYLGDEANYVSDTIGPTGASATNNMYMCDAESIPGHVWAPGDVIYAKVTDNGDGYTAGPVSVTTTGAGFDVEPTMTIQAAPDTTAPVIASPTATPSSIPADGATTSVLNVTVTDNVGIASVTVNLVSIGGSATTAMTKVGTTNVYSVTTTASTSTSLGTKSLTVTATDTSANTATSTISLTVTAIPDTFAPSVTNPTATPSTIYANGIATSLLSVTVTDSTGIASVKVDLSAIGGSATTAMAKVGTTDVYSVTTTASPSTVPGTYNLAVTATDSSTNANTNTSVSISLTVQALPVTITSASVENPTASRAQNFTVRIAMSSTSTGWYVVVVSGTASGGEGIAGIGTVYLTAGQSVTNMPVLVHIPSQATLGAYTLYAGAYAIGDYPANLASIIDYEGPVTATVT